MLYLIIKISNPVLGVSYTVKITVIYIFKENSTVLFTDNIAGCGGAINLFADSHMYFEGHSITIFNKNTATDRGGALYLGENSHISFEENSTTEFSNSAADNGGLYFQTKMATYILKDIL